MNLEIGTLVGIICSVIAIGNFLVHVIGYIKIRNFKETIAIGIFSSIPLGIFGVINFILLLQLT